MEDTMPDTPMDPVSGSEAPNDAQGAVPTRQRRLPLGLRLLLWVFALLIGLPLAAATVLLATAFFFRSEPGAHMPQGFSAYASLPSASAFINEALHLKALDAALSSPESAALRASVRTLRANPALRSPAFLKIGRAHV